MVEVQNPEPHADAEDRQDPGGLTVARIVKQPNNDLRDGEKRSHADGGAEQQGSPSAQQPLSEVDRSKTRCRH